ncbi:MAG: PH domain-containing protein [Clostridiaceae bacterium]|nr:PH domain-containing protein [Clostridiaceae bacterium]
MTPIRCHFTIIFERTAGLIWQLIPAFLLPLLTTGRLRGRAWILFSVLAAIICLIIGWQYISWRHTWLAADEQRLLIRRGLVWKKQLAIPFDKINTVDLSRHFFQRLVGTCRLKIDTGAVTGNGKNESEVNLVFSRSQAEKIRSLILSLTQGKPGIGVVHTPDDVEAESAAADPNAAEPHQPVEFRAGSMDFFLYGLTQNKLWGCIIVAFSLMTFAGELFGERSRKIAERITGQAWEQIVRADWPALLAIAFFLVIICYLAANIASILYALIRFYHFRARRIGDNIYIDYGFLTVKNYTLPVKNIHALIINQNLLRQCFRQCSVELVSIGYGDDKNEVALLFPLIAADQLEPLLHSLLPEYAGKESLVLSPAPQAALRRYLLWPLLIFLLPTLLITVFWPPFAWVLLPGLPLLLASRWLNYRHAGLAYGSGYLEASCGGFTRHDYRVRLDAIQSIGVRSHPLLERDNLYTYRIDYHAPVLRADIQIRYMDQRHLEHLRDLLT